MPEDWSSITAEVEGALRSIADVSQLGGYPATLEIPPAGGPGLPWEPHQGAATYATVYCMEGYREIRDVGGTTIVEVRKTLLVSATGTEPAKGQRIVVGINAEQVDFTDQPAWHEIIEVRPLSPAGVTVLYELDLGS